LRNRLRAHGRQLGDQLDEKKGTQTVDRLAAECAYEHWHRLLFARFLAENNLLIEPQSGMPLPLDECRELARERGLDWLVLASDFAQKMLPQIFRDDDPVLQVTLPPEKRQELEGLLEALPREMFIADDSLGWVYQFWQSDEKERVNKLGTKIGADEIPAVTQLFTDDYMVLFLLHNTLGAWWAGKIFATQLEISRTAGSEEELRAACALPGVNWEFLRFARGEDGVWQPAAGTFPGWPTTAKAITLLDPAMGSGHCLVFAFQMLVAIRMREEDFTNEEAVNAVLRDNLFGLEIDPRCTQIAAFNLAFAAWRFGGCQELPPLHLACSGLGVNATEEAWKALGEGSQNLRIALGWLYPMFRNARTLGSLINPAKSEAAKIVELPDLLRAVQCALAREDVDDTREMGVRAFGVAQAATILASEFTLVLTNVPYLVKGKQIPFLQEYTTTYCREGAQDLATVFLKRCKEFTARGGTHATVTPQNWLFLKSYSRFRKRLIEEQCVQLVAKAGSGANATASWDVLRALAIVSRTSESSNYRVSGIEITEPDEAGRARALAHAPVLTITRDKLEAMPDTRFAFSRQGDSAPLSMFADSYKGICSGDVERFQRYFWELSCVQTCSGWVFQQSTINSTLPFGGREGIFLWEDGRGAFLNSVVARLGRTGVSAWLRGGEAWKRQGVVVRITRELPVTIYQGEIFDNNVAVIVPKKAEYLPALWAYCSSDTFNADVRKLNQKLSVTDDSFVQVPFDCEHWQQVASKEYPCGLPKPHSHDPTQWLFDGHPNGSDHPLQVAAARLLGYRWPRQTGSSFPDCVALGSDALESSVDDDGVVGLSALKGEPPAADRLRAVVSVAYGSEWSPTKLSELVASAGSSGGSLDGWLRNRFFDQHYDLFHQRPFIWNIWDGLQNGFSALVNYHKLAAPNGEGRRTLEKLIYTYLGDWIDRQRADQKVGVEGADARVAAAEYLKCELEKILAGEPPYDIFVRWKPLSEQPVGWDPDINDGVRINIRPFMFARPLNAGGKKQAKDVCILRVPPKITWGKDRGREPSRAKADYPWFWGWDEKTPDFLGGSVFDGNRWNDLHYSRAVKLAARERAKGGKS